MTDTHQVSGYVVPAESASDPRVSAEAVSWAIRLFLGREPADTSEIEFHRQHHSVDELRKAFSNTPAFRSYLLAERREPDPLRTYAAPLWLLEAPDSSSIPWIWSPPTLEHPVSQLCTFEQMNGPLFENLCVELGLVPRQHRKVWEFAYILSAMRSYGLLRENANLLGFGAGTEPLPSAFASVGAHVLATDAPPEVIEGQGWETTKQHSTMVKELHWPKLITLEEFDRRVSFRPVDMNNIPPDLVNFDCCWSACAFEHLGDIESGLKFVENSLKTLKPGGYAIHTTEFNLSSNDETVETRNLCLFRRQDIERLLIRLTAQGHKVMPLNLFPGVTQVDAHIDAPPWSSPHLKIQIMNFVTTSIGLIVQRGA